MKRRGWIAVVLLATLAVVFIVNRRFSLRPVNAPQPIARPTSDVVPSTPRPRPSIVLPRPTVGTDVPKPPVNEYVEKAAFRRGLAETMRAEREGEIEAIASRMNLTAEQVATLLRWTDKRQDIESTIWSDQINTES